MKKQIDRRRKKNKFFYFYSKKYWIVNDKGKFVLDHWKHLVESIEWKNTINGIFVFIGGRNFETGDSRYEVYSRLPKIYPLKKITYGIRHKVISRMKITTAPWNKLDELLYKAGEKIDKKYSSKKEYKKKEE